MKYLPEDRARLIYLEPVACGQHQVHSGTSYFDSSHRHGTIDLLRGTVEAPIAAKTVYIAVSKPPNIVR